MQFIDTTLYAFTFKCNLLSNFKLSRHRLKNKNRFLRPFCLGTKPVQNAKGDMSVKMIVNRVRGNLVLKIFTRRKDHGFECGELIRNRIQ